MAVNLNGHIGIACSDIQFRLNDAAQTAICGRNMDFPIPMHSKIIKHLIGEEMVSQAPDGNPGFSWKSKYGYLGISAFGNVKDNNSKIAVDGLNTQGLSGGVLTLIKTQYQTVPEGHHHYAISQMDLLDYILGTCTTVKEVKEAISDKYIWGQSFSPLPSPPLLHYSFHDINGDNLVVEFLEGRAVFYDNPNGVLTNDPSFTLQLENLAKYNGLSCDPAPSIVINGLEIPSPGPGSGTIGLPGSSDPQSRFVLLSKIKAFMTENSSLESIPKGISAAVQLLGRVHVIEGEQRVSFNNTPCLESTLWSVIKVLSKNPALYFYTKNNPEIQYINIDQVNFEPEIERPKAIPICTEITFNNITRKFQTGAIPVAEYI